MLKEDEAKNDSMDRRRFFIPSVLATAHADRRLDRFWPHLLFLPALYLILQGRKKKKVWSKQVEPWVVVSHAVAIRQEKSSIGNYTIIISSSAELWHPQSFSVQPTHSHISLRSCSSLGVETEREYTPTPSFFGGSKHGLCFLRKSTPWRGRHSCTTLLRGRQRGKRSFHTHLSRGGKKGVESAIF